MCNTYQLSTQIPVQFTLVKIQVQVLIIFGLNAYSHTEVNQSKKNKTVLKPALNWLIFI